MYAKSNLAVIAVCVTLVIGSFSSAVRAADEVAGTYNVTLTETGTGTCPQKQAGRVSAQQWIISTMPDGSVTVSALGETAFSALEGKQEGDSLILVGYSSKGESTWTRVKIDGNELLGLRRYMAMSTFMSKKKGKVKAPCFLDLDIAAKKA